MWKKATDWHEDQDSVTCVQLRNKVTAWHENWESVIYVQIM